MGRKIGNPYRSLPPAQRVAEGIAANREELGIVTPIFKETQGVDLGAERRRWKRERPGVLRRSPWCLAGNVLERELPGHRCGRSCSQIHHRRTVKDLGQWRLGANHLPVCVACHAAIHSHPLLSRRLGLLVAQGDPEWDLLGYVVGPPPPGGVA